MDDAESLKPEMESLRPEILSDTSTLDALHLRLATQIAPARWKRSLTMLVAQVQGGTPLETAIAKTQSAMPAELSKLVQAAIGVPDPTKLILDALRIRQRSRAVWRDFTIATMYPLGLFMVALIVAVAFNMSVRGMMSLSFLDEFGLSGADFVHAQINDQSQATVGLAVATFWFAAVLLTMRLLGPPWAWTAVVGGLVIVGKPMRWISLEELLHRYRLFAERGLDSVTTAQSAAASLRQSSQSIVADRVARQVAAGVPLGEAISDSLFADGLTRPIIRFLDADSTSTMPERLDRCAGILRSITVRRCQTLVAVLPLLALMIVGTLICSAIFSYMLAFMPLVRMITSLS